MSLKATATLLPLPALLAVGAILILGSHANQASATAGGHLTSNHPKTTILGLEIGGHKTEFVPGAGAGVICEDATYHGEMPAATVTALTVTPNYGNKCKTTNGTPVTITTHGCTFEFTIHADPEVKHSTVHLKCPPGKGITISDGPCLITINPQTVTGVVYTKEGWEGTKALTLDFTVKNIQYTLHSGICSLGGTTRNDGEFKGAMIAKAWQPGKVGMKGGGADIEVTKNP